MQPTNMWHRGTDRLVLTKWLPWTLPPALAVVSVVYETLEHLIAPRGRIADFGFEVVVFGVLGPLAAFAALIYMRNVVRARYKAEQRTAALNRGLEREVADRTAHLERAQDQLQLQAEQLAVANAELRQLDKLKSDFLSFVSHELRAPLTTLSGGLEVIAQDARSLPFALQRTLTILAAETERLRGLVESILDASRTEAGHLQLTFGPVWMEPLVRRCITSIGASTITFDGARNLPPVWGDEVYLERILRNILMNAVSYSPPESAVEVVARVRDESIAIAVSNRGPAISTGDQRRIFDAFYRVENSETLAEGYGLGLYFVRQLIEAHGGQVSVSSPAFDDGGLPGAMFELTLPIARDECS